MSTYTPIASQTLGSAAATVTFSSIPQGYTDLVIVGNGYGTISNGQAPTLIFNSDTSALYSRTVLSGNGTAASSTRYSGGTSIVVGNAVGWETDSTKPAMFIAHIMNYSNTTTFKTILARDGAANTTYPGTEANVGLYRSTNAINSIQIKAGGSANFASGSTFSIYGIQVGDKAQKAQGGNIVTSSGGYMYHAFTSSGVFIPNEPLTAEVLVIAGGGGGGGTFGGGGAAGGVSYHSGKSFARLNYPVTVGAGGAATANLAASAGGNSIVNGITSNGGGPGGNYNNITSQNLDGGSGGGAVGDSPASAAGTATQGNTGGATGYGNNGGTRNGFGAGGGGGAGVAGGNASGSSNGGVGGDGLNTWSTWASATSTGVSGYYAGGAGGYQNIATATAGGAGGGGFGGTSVFFGGSGNGGPATVNTGSGGGGSVGAGYGGTPAPGASGIVIIRYAI
jgi:hypothetical protein